MSLDVLCTCPASPKLFVDLVASSHFVKSHFPDLSLDILVASDAIPKWWSKSSQWIRVFHNAAECESKYDLIIQTTPDKNLSDALNQLDCENRTGVVLSPQLCVVGRWAQTLVGQVGATRFSPFTPFDLFNNVLLGRTALNFNYPSLNLNGDWIVDLDSFPNDLRGWGESVLSNLSLSHPGRVFDHIKKNVTPKSVACYIGADSAACSWFSFNGSLGALILLKQYSPAMAPANPRAWIIPAESLPTPGQMTQMLNSKEMIFGKCFRLTDEFLGGAIIPCDSNPIDDSLLVFDRLNYVVFNYLNDLTEIDIPIPEVTASCCMRLKGTKTVCDKIIHLNLFAIKFLQEFLDKIKDTTVRDQDIAEITGKINEVDMLTDKSLAAYPELDLVRLVSHFSKASAQGANIIEISKSLILVYHEMNQAISAINELIQIVIDKHSLKTSTVAT